MDASTNVAARVNLPHPSATEPAKPVMTGTTEAQLVLPTPEPIMEATPLAVQEASPKCRKLNLLPS